MRDLNLRVVLYVLPVVLAVVAAVFIAQTGTFAGDATEQAPQAVDMSVPF